MSDFATTIKNLTAELKQTKSIKSPFTRKDSEQALEAIRAVYTGVADKMQRLGIEHATGDDLVALVELDGVLKGLKATERMRLAAIEKFEAMAGVCRPD